MILLLGILRRQDPFLRENRDFEVTGYLPGRPSNPKALHGANSWLAGTQVSQSFA